MMTALLYLAYNCRPELGDQSADEIFAGEPRIERMLLQLCGFGDWNPHRDLFL